MRTSFFPALFRMRISFPLQGKKRKFQRKGNSHSSKQSTMRFPSSRWRELGDGTWRWSNEPRMFVRSGSQLDVKRSCGWHVRYACGAHHLYAHGAHEIEPTKCNGRIQHLFKIYYIYIYLLCFICMEFWVLKRLEFSFPKRSLGPRHWIERHWAQGLTVDSELVVNPGANEDKSTESLSFALRKGLSKKRKHRYNSIQRVTHTAQSNNCTFLKKFLHPQVETNKTHLIQSGQWQCIILGGTISKWIYKTKTIEYNFRV